MVARRLAALALCVLLATESFSVEESSARTTPQTPTGENLTVEKVFHIAGIPGQRRNERVNLILDGKTLVCERKNKKVLAVPYERFRQTQFLSGERHYPEATYAAAVATFGVGGLLLLKKRKMDVLVVDFVNERGGRMGLVLQLPLGQGAACKNWLVQRGVSVEEPAPPAPRVKKP